MRWNRAFGLSVVGAVAMSVAIAMSLVMAVARTMRIPTSLEMILGTTTGGAPGPWVAALAVHLAFGGIFGLICERRFEAIHCGGASVNLSAGLVHAVAAHPTGRVLRRA